MSLNRPNWKYSAIGCSIVCGILIVMLGLNRPLADERDPHYWASHFAGERVLSDGTIAMQLLFDRPDNQGLEALREVDGLLWWTFHNVSRDPRPPGYTVDIEVPARSSVGNSRVTTVLTLFVRTERLLNATNLSPDFYGRRGAGHAYTGLLEVRRKSDRAEMMFGELCQSEFYREVSRHICQAIHEAPLLIEASHHEAAR
jgi:hypothetical protein